MSPEVILGKITVLALIIGQLGFSYMKFFTEESRSDLG